MLFMASFLASLLAYARSCDFILEAWSREYFMMADSEVDR